MCSFVIGALASFTNLFELFGHLNIKYISSLNWDDFLYTCQNSQGVNNFVKDKMHYKNFNKIRITNDKNHEDIMGI